MRSIFTLHSVSVGQLGPCSLLFHQLSGAQGVHVPKPDFPFLPLTEVPTGIFSAFSRTFGSCAFLWYSGSKSFDVSNLLKILFIKSRWRHLSSHPQLQQASSPRFFKHFQSVLRPLKALWRCVYIPRGVFEWMLWELFREGVCCLPALVHPPL